MSDSTGIFVEEARRYCRLIEEGGSNNSWLFARECLNSVLRLYTAALELPAKEPHTIELPDRIDHSAWQTLYRRVGQKLAREGYWEVFEPFEQEQPESIRSSLPDDLADVWRDVKAGLLAIKPNLDLFRQNEKSTEVDQVGRSANDMSKTDWGRVKQEAAEDAPIPYELEDGPYDPNHQQAVEDFLAQATIRRHGLETKKVPFTGASS